MKISYKILTFLFLILSVGCLKEEFPTVTFSDFTPKVLSDGWEVSTTQAEGIDSSKLAEVFHSVSTNQNLWPLRSLLVFRNNKLIAESYFKDENDITSRHPIWSCTKQFVGLLSIMALENGLIESLDDPISKYMEEEFAGHEDKSEITIRQLLTMQSGIDYNNGGAQGQTDKILRQLPKDIVEFILDRPMINTPGEVFHYNDGDPQLLAAMIQKITGQPTDVWADEILFSKIGFSNYEWYRYKDGITLGGFGILTTPREMGKVGQFILYKGIWDGEKITDSLLINEMLQTQIEVDEEYSFGYYWWIDNSTSLRFMWGHGGQFMFVIPEKDMVVVATSEAYTDGEYQIQANEILPIVKDIIKLSN